MTRTLPRVAIALLVGGCALNTTPEGGSWAYEHGAVADGGWQDAAAWSAEPEQGSGGSPRAPVGGAGGHQAPGAPAPVGDGDGDSSAMNGDDDPAGDGDGDGDVPTCELPADTEWDCHRWECNGDTAVEVIDDSDSRPYVPTDPGTGTVEHPLWSELHQTPTSTNCEKWPVCLDGEPNVIVQRPDGSYGPENGWCFTCDAGAFTQETCP